MSGAVEWVLPEGPAPYFRARLVGTRYDFGQ
jgi:hypothetical protein